MWESWSDESESLLCILSECFPPLDQLKNPVAVTYAYQPRSVVLLSLSDLQMPHLHCLQWSMWSHTHSCHVIAWLCFCYHFPRKRLHSLPSNFLSKASMVLYTGLITGAQRQSQSFNHREHILALPSMLASAPGAAAGVALLLFPFLICLRNVHYSAKINGPVQVYTTQTY